VSHRAAAIALGVVMLHATTTAQAPETFTATASIKQGGVSATAPVTVTVTRYTSPAERAAIMKSMRDGGSSAMHAAVAALPAAGFIQLGERRTTIRFAGERATGSGRLITVVTGEPILFLGAGLPQAKQRTGFDVAVAMLDVGAGGGGLGELAPAAKVAVEEDGAFQIEDYGATVIWLKELARAK
jgi:hypothetical protein